MEKDIIVFDLETKKDFAEVGGRDNLWALGVSVIGAYFYKNDSYRAFEESETDEFIDLAKNSELLIGFNIRDFDLPVLQPYAKEDLSSLSFLDMMDEIVKGMGFRISLDNLCRMTLGISKIADGLQAVRWFREGEIAKIKEYCLQDVRMTKELYDFGKENGHVLCVSRESGRVAIPVSAWGSGFSSDIKRTLEEAFRKRRSVELEYVTKTSSSPANKDFCNKRVVDISRLGKDSFEGYCHLRKASRVFRIDRVLEAKILGGDYQLSRDKQNILF